MSRALHHVHRIWSLSDNLHEMCSLSSISAPFLLLGNYSPAATFCIYSLLRSIELNRVGKSPSVYVYSSFFENAALLALSPPSDFCRGVFVLGEMV